MKQSSKHIAFLDFGSFPGTIMFIVGLTYEEVLKHSKKKYKDWLPAIDKFNDEDKFCKDEWGHASKKEVNNVTSFFIWLRKPFTFTDEDFIYLSHEVLHIVSFNLREKLDPMLENEALCYTHTHVMEQCLKILRS